MAVAYNNFLLCLPLFIIIGAGYFFGIVGLLSKSVGDGLAKFSFTVAIPILLFKTMADVTHLPTPHWTLTLAFFGGGAIVFIVAHVIGKYFFNLSSEERTMFGITGIYSNDVQLGIPITLSLLGAQALPSIALIFSLDCFVMFTVAIIAIEFARNNSPSIVKTFFDGLIATLKNPIVVGVIAGLVWGLIRVEFPTPVQKAIDLIANSATPVALFSIGVGLASYKITSRLAVTIGAVCLKLVLMPLSVFTLCRLMGLGLIETQSACIMSCLPSAINTYVMANSFKVMEEQAASILLITTTLASVTLPITMSLLGLI